LTIFHAPTTTSRLFNTIPRPRKSTLFPYTTLFRSKEGANPDKIMQALTEYELVPEAWGGETIFVNISAKQRTNLEELLEMILLVDRKSTRLNSSHVKISYAVFCLKKKKKIDEIT